MNFLSRSACRKLRVLAAVVASIGWSCATMQATSGQQFLNSGFLVQPAEAPPIPPSGIAPNDPAPNDPAPSGLGSDSAGGDLGDDLFGGIELPSVFAPQPVAPMSSLLSQLDAIAAPTADTIVFDLEPLQIETVQTARNARTTTGNSGVRRSQVSVQPVNSWIWTAINSWSVSRCPVLTCAL